VSGSALRARAVPLALAALGAAGWYAARHLDLYTDDGPGSGLLPKVALAFVVVLALLISFAPTSEGADETRIETPRAFVVYSVVAILFAIAVPFLGFVIPALIATGVIMRFAEDRSWFASLLYAFLLVATIVLSFGTALQVQFPAGPAEVALKSLGVL
jgi:hypothetical protein